MTQAELLAEQLGGTRKWTLKLIADLECDDWTFQPCPGVAHALWLCGHLTTAQNSLVHARCLSQSVLEDNFKRHFAVGVPVKSAAEHDYPPVEAVLAKMGEVHRKTCEAVRTMSDEFLAQPAFGPEGKPHPHYSDKRGAVAHCNRHEAFHAGQLALIRRLRGKAFLR